MFYKSFKNMKKPFRQTMQIPIKIICLAISIFLYSEGAISAQMVRYVDVNGKIHYVNMKFNKVPDQYLEQVQDQMEAFSKPEGNNVSVTTAPDVEKNSQALVELFTEAGCENCRKLKILLKVFEINYTEYDVKNTDYGKKVFKTVGGELPITKVGEKLFHGNRFRAIQAEIKKNKPEN